MYTEGVASCVASALLVVGSEHGAQVQTPNESRTLNLVAVRASSRLSGTALMKWTGKVCEVGLQPPFVCWDWTERCI